MKLLGIRFLHDGVVESILSVNGLEDSPMESLAFEYKGGDDAHFMVDELLADESMVLFNSEDSIGRFFYKNTPEYKTISTSMIFGALKDEDSLNLKPYLISEIVDCFLEQPDTANSINSLSKMALYSAKAYPNPFREKLVFEISLEEISELELKIFSQEGRLIKKFDKATYQAGEYKIIWDTRNEEGNYICNGLYYYHLRIDNDIKTDKIILVK